MHAVQARSLKKRQGSMIGHASVQREPVHAARHFLYHHRDFISRFHVSFFLRDRVDLPPVYRRRDIRQAYLPTRRCLRGPRARDVVYV